MGYIEAVLYISHFSNLNYCFKLNKIFKKNFKWTILYKDQFIIINFVFIAFERIQIGKTLTDELFSEETPFQENEYSAQRYLLLMINTFLNIIENFRSHL